MFSWIFRSFLFGILAIVPMFSVCSSYSSVMAAESARVTEIPGFDTGKNFSQSNPLGKKASGDNFEDKVENAFLSSMKVAKVLIALCALLFLVIAGAQMVFSQGDEEALKKGKTQIFHALLAFIFFTAPGEILRMFTQKEGDLLTSSAGSYADVGTSGNLLVGRQGLDATIGTNLSGFLQVFIAGYALLMFTYAAFLYLRSGDNDERRVEAKNKLLYGTMGLILLGFSQVYIRIVSVSAFSGGDVSSAVGTAFAMAAYLIVPLSAGFYLYASYLYIFSMGEEERVKKGKSIFLYTTIGLFLFFGVYSILKDIQLFTLS